MKTFTRSTLAALAIATLGAFTPFAPAAYANGGEDWRYTQHGSANPGVANISYGVVTAVEQGRSPGAEINGGAGALIGGVLGAVLGRQVAGRGDARTAGTFVGAVAGALIGHQVERHRSRGESSVARVSVQLDRGGVITLDGADVGDLRVGERVRVENNRVYRVARRDGGLQYEHS
jgi:outer membrane lipoprotein SlyB